MKIKLNVSKFFLALVLIASLLGIVNFSTIFAITGNNLPITGQTTKINDANNAGIIHFDGVDSDGKDYAPADRFKVHLVKVGAAYEMRGWAWDDNLGWVSFYCKGDGTKNSDDQGLEGGECGSYAYGITFTPDGSGNYLASGYAWNDATGWISMSCSNTKADCSGIVQYGLKIDKDGFFIDQYDSQKYKYAWAWSNSVGWFNFSGVRAGSIEILDKNCETDPYIAICITCDGTNSPLNCDFGDPSASYDIAGKIKVADGVNPYTIRIYLKNSAGQFIKNSDLLNNYDIKILFNWEDSVKANQMKGKKCPGTGLTNCKYNYYSNSFNSNSDIPATERGGIIEKPVLLYYGDTTQQFPAESNVKDANSKKDLSATTLWDTLNNIPNIKLNVKAIAPTTDANLSKALSTGKYIKNSDFSLISSTINSAIEKNTLKLSSIDWYLKDKTTGKILKGNTPFGLEGSFNFKPALTINTLNSSTLDPTQADTSQKTLLDNLALYRNVPVTLKMTGGKNTTVNLLNPKTGFYINYEGGGFEVGFTEDTKIALGTTFKLPSTDYDNYHFLSSFNIISSINPSIQASLLSGSPAAHYAQGAGLYSTIMYYIGLDDNTKFIQYYSNHIPRTASQGITNPTVEVQGTIYGQNVSSTQTGVNLTGIGDMNVNIVRDFIYENIQKLLRNTSFLASDGTVTLNDFSSCVSQTGCYILSVPSVVDEDIIYVAAKNVVLKSSGDITWSDHNKVLIVDGGNLFIDSNLYNGTTPTKKLGIVVLRNPQTDLTLGHIYIGPNVTNIQALMVADGSLFSYPGQSGGATFNTYGEVIQTLDPNTYNKQLLIEGGISTRNLIGFTDKTQSPNKFITPRGPVDNTDTGREIAKKYDLNYLRFFSLQIKFDADGNPVDQNGDDQIDATKPAPEGDLVVTDTTLQAKGLQSTDTNPVYIKQVGPYSKSLIFSEKKNLTF